MSTARRSGKTPYLLSLPGLAWLVVFFAVPLYFMLSFTFYKGSIELGFSYSPQWLQTYTDALSAYRTQIIRSFAYGLIVTAATLVMSYPLAYWIATKGGRRKNLYLLLLLLPFFTPFLIRTISWTFVLADEGVFLGPLKDARLLPGDFRLLATSVAVVFGLIYNYLPFMTLPLYVALERLDPALREAAQDLYSNRRETFLRVTFPLSLPGVFAGSLLTFIPVVGDFINSEFLGGPNTSMIGNVIQRLLLVNGDYPVGGALSFLLIAGILIGVFLYARALGTEELTG